MSISQEMPITSREPVTLQVDEVETKGVEKLMSLAEELQAKCELSESRRLMRTFQLIVIVGGIVAFTSGANYFLPDHMSRYSMLFAAIGIGYGVVFAGYGYLWMSRHYWDALRDQRALHEVVDMLREIEGALAKQKKMSTLERAEFRIRLSRFDIGPARSRPL